MIRCAQCGAVAPDDKKFCISCGQSLQDAEVIAVPAEPQPDTAEPQPETDKPQPETAEMQKTQSAAPTAPQANNPPHQGAPFFAPPPDPKRFAPLGVGQWFGIFVLLALPIVNFIMTIVWACSARRLTLKNFARALIIGWLVVLVLGIALGILLYAYGVQLSDTPLSREFFFRFPF